MIFLFCLVAYFIVLALFIYLIHAKKSYLVFQIYASSDLDLSIFSCILASLSCMSSIV